MTLMKSPLPELQQMQVRMDEQLKRQEQEPGTPTVEHEWQPPADLWEDERQWVLLVDLAGVEQKEIDLRVEEQMLEIRGERQLETEEGREYRRVERTYGRFCRRFALPEAVERGRVRATFDQGVLRVVLPKGDSCQPLQIEVEGDGG